MTTNEEYKKGFKRGIEVAQFVASDLARNLRMSALKQMKEPKKWWSFRKYKTDTMMAGVMNATAVLVDDFKKLLSVCDVKNTDYINRGDG